MCFDGMYYKRSCVYLKLLVYTNKCWVSLISVHTDSSNDTTGGII